MAGTRICHGVAILEAGRVLIELVNIVCGDRIERGIGLYLEFNRKWKKLGRVLDSSEDEDGINAMASK